MFDFFKGIGTKALIGGVAAVGLYMIFSNSGSGSTPKPRNTPTAKPKSTSNPLNGITKKKKKCATVKV